MRADRRLFRACFECWCEVCLKTVSYPFECCFKLSLSAILWFALKLYKISWLLFLVCLGGCFKVRLSCLRLV